MDASRLSELTPLEITFWVFSCVVVGALLIAFWLIARRTLQGTVFAIALVIYLGSWQIETGQSRELRVLAGSLGMIGCCGLIIGVIDLFTNKNRAKEVDEPIRSSMPNESDLDD